MNNVPFEVQTRDYDGMLHFYPTVKQAFEAAEVDKLVWKVSFPTADGARARFVRTDDQRGWIYEQIF